MKWFGPMLAVALVGAWWAAELCFSSDAQAMCCPAACAARKGKQWHNADEILRGCMRGMGCSDSSVEGATVFLRCDCGGAR